MTESKAYPPWLFWLAASSFVWAFLICPLAVKKLGIGGWFGNFGYSILCTASGVYTLRKNWSVGLMFALTNFGFAIAWAIFVVWAVTEFAKHFWK
jgi:hypothetical protein